MLAARRRCGRPARPRSRPRRRRRAHLALDLTLLAIVGVLLVAAVAAGVAVLYREFYSPSAFVERYLDTARGGRAPPTRSRCPACPLDSADLEAAGLPADGIRCPPAIAPRSRR